MFGFFKAANQSDFTNHINVGAQMRQKSRTRSLKHARFSNRKLLVALNLTLIALTTPNPSVHALNDHGKTRL